MSTEKYNLNVEHLGTEPEDFCIYQTNYNQSEDIRPLVWFSKRAHPGTDLRFKWGIDYGFTWNEQGALTPDAAFTMDTISNAHAALQAEETKD